MTDWWNKNVEKRINDFSLWIDDHNHPLKKYCREHVIKNKYSNIIDCGSGLASEYYGYKHDQYNIDYTGLDSCKYLIDLHRSNGITMIEAELESNLPIKDNVYDCVYCKAVIEHLSYYEKAISEFIRIGKKEVIIGWFIKPDTEPDQINYWKEEDLYHNKYNKDKLEKFILKDDKVASIEWFEVNDKENVLHIKLK